MEEQLQDLEKKETEVRDSRMALVATEILNGVVLLYEFLPVEEARMKIKELRDNAL